MNYQTFQPHADLKSLVKCYWTLEVPAEKNAGEDLQPMLDKIEKSGGEILVPKMEISPEMGYFALFIDSEGNKIGLHSSN